jgi:hypothetical protein
MPITDLATRIVDREPAQAGLQELKHWQALVAFVAKLPGTDRNGIPDVSGRYGSTQERS